MSVFCEQSSHSMSSSLKNEMDLLKHSLPFGSSLHKNEIIPQHSSFSISRSLKNEVGFLKHSLPFGFNLA